MNDWRKVKCRSLPLSQIYDSCQFGKFRSLPHICAFLRKISLSLFLSRKKGANECVSIDRVFAS